MAKLSWLLLLAGGYWNSLQAPIVPGLGLLARVPGGTVWFAAAFWIGGVCLLCNRGVRGACVLVGGVVLLAPFESIMVWHPYAWVCGGVLLLCALQDPGSESRIVRWFLVLVHGAAALGAVGGAGWINTALAAPWAEDDYLGALPRSVAGLLPDGALARGLLWVTVLVCITIPAGLLVPRLRRAAAGVALLFYTLLYVALGSTEVLLFAGAIATAQISCLEWPRHIVVVWPRACGWPLFLRVVLDRYDFENRTDWPRPPDPDAELEARFDLRPAAGTKAITNLLLSFPVFYFTMLAVITGVHALLPRVFAVSINSALVFGLLGFSTFAGLRRLRSRKGNRPAPSLPKLASEVTGDAASSPFTPAAATNGPVGTSDVTAGTDTPRRSDR